MATIAALRNSLWRAKVSETSNIRSSMVEALIDRLNLNATLGKESKRQIEWVGKGRAMALVRAPWHTVGFGRQTPLTSAPPAQVSRRTTIAGGIIALAAACT